jgi:hypothetical protein
MARRRCRRRQGSGRPRHRVTRPGRGRAAPLAGLHLAPRERVTAGYVTAGYATAGYATAAGPQAARPAATTGRPGPGPAWIVPGRPAAGPGSALAPCPRWPYLPALAVSAQPGRIRSAWSHPPSPAVSAQPGRVRSAWPYPLSLAVSAQPGLIRPAWPYPPSPAVSAQPGRVRPAWRYPPSLAAKPVTVRAALISAHGPGRCLGDRYGFRLPARANPGARLPVGWPPRRHTSDRRPPGWRVARGGRRRRARGGDSRRPLAARPPKTDHEPLSPE